ncbi:hypothetical protein V5770_13675, partial [Staphylococcus simulans]
SITVPKGKDGISVTVKGTSQDPNGNTVIEFSDGSKVTVQRGKDGRDGKDGKSITVTGQTIDPNGNTVVTFSDGNSITVPKGKDGISVTVKGTSQDP